MRVKCCLFFVFIRIDCTLMAEKNKVFGVVMLLCCMVLQSTGAISFNDIQTEFGGANPIGIDEYFANNASGYTSGVTGIPNAGTPISMSQFYGKQKGAVTDFMVSGNVAGNMNETGGARLSAIQGADDSSTSIGTIGFVFNYFGTDHGTNSTVYWNTNNVLQFGTNVGTITWSATTGRGILMGNADRRTNWATTFPTYTSNSHSIKKILVNQANYYGTSGTEIQMEIRLIRGPSYQYIELRMALWAAANAGAWNLTNGSTFFNVFSGAPPIGTGASLVMRSDLNGSNWTVFNNRYINL